MKFVPRQYLADLVANMNRPLCERPIPVAALLEGMRRALPDLRGGEQFHSFRQKTIPLFEAFCRNVSELVVTDELPAEFETYMKKHASKGNPDYGRWSAALRDLLNAAGTKTGLLLRPIPDRYQCQRWKRLSKFSQKTLEALVFYEKSARQVKTLRTSHQDAQGTVGMMRHYSLLKKRLAPYATANRIDRTLSFLARLEKRCLLDVTEADFRRFLAQEERDKEVHLRLVTEVSSVFVNLHIAGFLPVNPIARVEYNCLEQHVRSDFISIENMQIIQNLSLAIDKETLRSARAIAFCNLAYDTALRLSELLYLQVQDIQDDPKQDVMTLRVLSEYQKGQGKQERIMLIFFPETRRALRHYLSVIRPQFNPVCNSLFISNHGTVLSHPAATSDIVTLTTRLGIKTYKGEKVTAHIFRHTFATLNVGTLGLQLSLENIIERLRHDDRETARKVYITDNPYLEKHRHQLRLDSQKAFDPFAGLRAMPSDNVLKFLRDDWGASERLLRDLEASRQQKLDLAAMNTELARPGQPLALLSEENALGLLRAYDLKAEAFRKVAMKMGQCRQTGSGYLYAEELIWKLKQDYLLIQDAHVRLHCTIRSLYNHREELGLLTIGKTVLVRREAVMARAINSAAPSPAPT